VEQLTRKQAQLSRPRVMIGGYSEDAPHQRGRPGMSSHLWARELGPIASYRRELDGPVGSYQARCFGEGYSHSPRIPLTLDRHTCDWLSVPGPSAPPALGPHVITLPAPGDRLKPEAQVTS
jgi:hypothetical protein